MAAPIVYRSSDAGAPSLIGAPGSLIDLLDAILVNGYGAAFAIGVVTNDAVQPADGDTVTVGTTVYTLKTTIGTTAYNVALGGSATATMQNLASAINGNGTIGTAYAVGTVAHPDVWAANTTAAIMTVTARRGGTAGNSIALAKSSTHLTVSGSSLAGGSGSVTKSSAGWSKAFSGPFPATQAVYRQAAGCSFYLQVDDSGPGTGTFREARCFAWESVSAWNTGTGQFPTVAQSSFGCVAQKSISLDGLARPWVAFADDRTFYFFVQDGSIAANYHGLAFGDFYSFLTGDAYKCMIFAGVAETTGGVNTSYLGQMFSTANIGFQHYLARNYAGVGGSTSFAKIGDGSMNTTDQNLYGTIGFPNPADGGMYVAPVRIIDTSVPGGTPSGTRNLRGRLRGFWHVVHPGSAFADGDSMSGSGEYAGKTFTVVKYLQAASTGLAVAAVETTAWDTSA